MHKEKSCIVGDVMHTHSVLAALLSCFHHMYIILQIDVNFIFTTIFYFLYIWAKNIFSFYYFYMIVSARMGFSLSKKPLVVK